MVTNFNVRDVKWVNGWKGYPEAWFKIKTPGVTTVINDMLPDPEMEAWIKKVGKEKVDEILTQAGYRGTAMHLFIENFVNTLAKSKDPSEALKYTQTHTPKELLEVELIPQNKIDEGRELFYKFYYSEFANSYDGLIKTEMGIYSPTLFYRGKADIFYKNRIFGETITDFKTSSEYIKKNSIKELKYKIQLGGYAGAVDEMLKDKNITIKRSTILCVNTKSEKLQEIVCEGKELEHFKNEFKTLVINWHKKNNQSYLIA